MKRSVTSSVRSALLVAAVAISALAGGHVAQIKDAKLAGTYCPAAGDCWFINQTYQTANSGSCNIWYDYAAIGWAKNLYGCSLVGTSAGTRAPWFGNNSCPANDNGVPVCYTAGLVSASGANQSYFFCVNYWDVMKDGALSEDFHSGESNQVWYIANVFGASAPPPGLTVPADLNTGPATDRWAGAQAAIWHLTSGQNATYFRTGYDGGNDAWAELYYQEALSYAASYAFVPYSGQPNHDQFYLSASTSSVTIPASGAPQSVTINWHATYANSQPQAGQAVTFSVQSGNPPTNANFAGALSTPQLTTNASGDASATLTVSAAPGGVVTPIKVVAADASGDVLNPGFAESNNTQPFINAAATAHSKDSNQQSVTINVGAPVNFGTPTFVMSLETVPGPLYSRTPGRTYTYVNIPTCVGVSTPFVADPNGYSQRPPAGTTFQTTLTPVGPFTVDFGEGQPPWPTFPTYHPDSPPVGQLLLSPHYSNGGWNGTTQDSVDLNCQTPAHFYAQVFPASPVSAQAIIHATEAYTYVQCVVPAPPPGIPACTPPTPVTFDATTTIAVYQIEGIPYVG